MTLYLYLLNFALYVLETRVKTGIELSTHTNSEFDALKEKKKPENTWQAQVRRVCLLRMSSAALGQGCIKLTLTTSGRVSLGTTPGTRPSMPLPGQLQTQQHVPGRSLERPWREVIGL